MRKVIGIQVGTHEDKVGFTQEYDDGEKQHFLFNPDVATDLGEGLIRMAKNLKYLEKNLNIPGDNISVSDYSRVEIQPPEEEEHGQD